MSYNDAQRSAVQGDHEEQYRRPDKAIKVALIGLVGTLGAAVIAAVVALITSQSRHIPPVATTAPTGPVVNDPTGTDSSVTTDDQAETPTVLADPGGISLLSLPEAGDFKQGQSVVGGHTYTQAMFAQQCYGDQLVVTLPPEQDRFRANFAMSDFGSEQAAVQVTLKLDGAPQQRHDVRRGHPLSIDLPLENARELEISYTGSFERGSVCDMDGQFVLVNPSFTH